MDTDIIIVGAGVTGLLAAILLAKQGLQITLIDAQKAPTVLTQDLRVVALTLASVEYLQQVGAWQYVDLKRVGTLAALQIGQQNFQPALHFAAADIKKEQLGFIVPQSILRMALYDVLKQHANIHCHFDTKPVDIQVQLQQVVLTFSDNKTIAAPLLLGADGVQSWVRQQAGFVLNAHDYAQTAIVAEVTLSDSLENTAWQIFLKEGVLAFLPLASSNQASIVFSANNTLAQTLLALPDDAFKTQLQSYMPKTLGDVLWYSQRLSYPLLKRKTDSLIKPRIALLGDAAHTIHPLAGQGLNLGMADAVALADIVTQAYAKQRDSGAVDTLQRYQRARVGEQRMMAQGMDGIQLLFKAQAWLDPLRQVGLMGLNACLPVKKWMMRVMCGC